MTHFVDLVMQTRNAALLLAAVVLLIGGLALIASYPQERRELLMRRLALIRRPTEAKAAQPRAGHLFGAAGGGQALPPWQQEIVRQFAWLRIPVRRAPLLIPALRVLGAVGLAALAFVLVARHAPVLAPSPAILVAITVGAAIGWFLPNFVGRRLLKRRIELIGIGLPDALELLVICEELERTSADLRILPSRDQALGNLAVRVDLPSIHSVVTTLNQTMRYGTPLAQALRVAAADLRNDSLLQLEEQANKLPVLLTIPMMLFMMPAIFLIVGGPAVLRLLDVLAR
jgi:tight adherence protein C